MEKISSKETIFNLVTRYPIVAVIMEDIGFKDITKPMMLQTAGRYMNLEKGANMKGIPWSKIEEEFSKHGFILERED
jgi:hypothetical protein